MGSEIQTGDLGLLATQNRSKDVNKIIRFEEDIVMNWLPFCNSIHSNNNLLIKIEMILCRTDSITKWINSDSISIFDFIFYWNSIQFGNRFWVYANSRSSSSRSGRRRRRETWTARGVKGTVLMPPHQHIIMAVLGMEGEIDPSSPSPPRPILAQHEAFGSVHLNYIWTKQEGYKDAKPEVERIFIFI